MLKDNFCLSGTDEKTFRKGLKDIVASTNCVPANLSLLNLLHKGGEDEKNIHVTMMNEDFSISSILTGLSCIPSIRKELEKGHDVSNLLEKLEGLSSTASLGRISKSSLNKALGETEAKALIRETTNWLYNTRSKDIMFMSKNCVTDVNARVKIEGSNFVESSLDRSALIKSTVNKVDTPIKLIIRTENGIKKVFAVTSGTYAYIPDTVVLDMMDGVQRSFDLGDWKMSSWTITHDWVQAIISFPEIAKDIADVYGIDLVPCLAFSTSSTGYSSIYCQSAWKYGNSYFVEDEARAEHRGNFDIDKFLSECSKTVFQDYFSVPDALCKAMVLNVTDPTWAHDKNFYAKNRDAVEETLTSIMKEMGVVAAIGKKNEKKLKELLLATFDYNIPFTVYDVLDAIMQSSEKLSGLNKVSMDKYQKLVKKAIFMDFDKVCEKSELKLAI